MRGVKGLTLAAAVTLILALSAAPAAAQVTSLRVTITSFEEEKIIPRGSFNVNFTLYKPAGIDVPTGSKVYLSMFYFVGDTIKFPSEYVEASYTPGVTNYTLKGKMKADAPVGQKVFLGAYWMILLDGNYSPSSPGVGDNVTVIIGGVSYTAPVVKVDPKTGYTYYYILDEAGQDVYTRSDKPSYLYVRALKSNVEIKAPVTEIPWLLIGGTVAALAIVGVVAMLALRKRRAARELPPPPPPPPGF